LKHRLKEVGADQIGKAVFVGPQQERIKVGQLLDALEGDYKLRGKDSSQFKSHLKHIRAYFGAWRAVEVSAEAVDKYIKERLEEEYAPASINRGTQLLSQAFGMAIDRKHLTAAPKIRHLSEIGNARQGFFADPDFHAIKGRLPEYLKDFAEFGYLTGWRKGEITSLRWEDVEGDIIRVRSGNTKNGDPRSVTLGGVLGELIERRKTDRLVKIKDRMVLTKWVFHLDGRPVGDFRKAWATASVAAGLGQFLCLTCDKTVESHKCKTCKKDSHYTGRLFHDFRRTAVRNMVRARVSEKIAMTISGHKTRSVFDRYDIVNEDDLREAMQRTQDYLKEGAQQRRHLAVMQSAVGTN